MIQLSIQLLKTILIQIAIKLRIFTYEIFNIWLTIDNNTHVDELRWYFNDELPKGVRIQRRTAM